EQKEHYREEEYNEEIEYDSDIYNNMNDNDLILIDEINKDLDQEFQAISMNELDYIQSNKKRLICTNYQLNKMRLDVKIKKLFQKKEQEIVEILEKFKNRVLKKNKAVTKYLGIQHIELICIIRKIIKEYDYIQHKIVQDQQTSIEEMELLEINTNKLAKQGSQPSTNSKRYATSTKMR
ncbi:31776_t:CDS:2, partial [Gigaspora margarita]